jgi:hypothetical protein
MVQAVNSRQHLNKSKPFRKFSNKVCGTSFGAQATNCEFLLQHSMMVVHKLLKLEACKVQLLLKVQENDLL